MPVRALLFLLSACTSDALRIHPESERPALGDLEVEADARPFRVTGPGVFGASLPAAGTHAQIDQDGVYLGDPRSGGLRVRLAAQGEDTLARTLPRPGACESSPCRPRVEFVHPTLTERWTRTDRGLTQVFQVVQPNDPDLLTLHVAVEGARTLETDGELAWMRGADGRRWTVSGLRSWDDRGEALESWMEVEGDTLRFVVDTRGARFPVIVDPVYDTAEMTLEGASTNAYLGSSLSAAGDVNGDGYQDVVISALGANDYFGSVYVYYGDGESLSETPSELVGESGGGTFGYSVAGLGDVNGDGYDDIGVGETYDATGQGAVHVYGGGADGPESEPIATLLGPSSGSIFGFSVAGGDLDGDGYGDVIVGAPGADSGAGVVYVYLGADGGPDTEASAELSSDTSNTYLGYSVARAGDTNGDGYQDVIGGGPLYLDGSGSAWIFHGGEDGLDSSPSVELSGFPPSALLGASVAGAGDINGDGYDDVMAGGYLYNYYQGQAQVFLGSSSGVDTAASATFTGAVSGDFLGYALAGVGDVNADGYDDVMVGAVTARDAAGAYPGEVYLAHGSESGLDMADLTTLAGAANGDYFGGAVAGVGDVNADGCDDVLIGALYAGTSDLGAAYLYLGYAQDEDGDGYLASEECDDEDATVYPGAAETCDGKDTDCDGVLPDDEQDADGDGYMVCEADCDDAAADAWPGAEEVVGDGVDQDCDGVESCYADADGDGARTEELVPGADLDCDDAGEALGEAVLDCDDADPTVLPGVDEACDGKDTDCNGEIRANEVDADEDGVMTCEGDCDDSDPAFGPQVEDIPDDGVDQDCDGEDAHATADTADTADTGDGSGAEDTGEDKGGGCACSSAPAPRGGLLIALGLALALRRRRPAR